MSVTDFSDDAKRELLEEKEAHRQNGCWTLAFAETQTLDYPFILKISSDIAILCLIKGGS